MLLPTAFLKNPFCVLRSFESTQQSQGEQKAIKNEISACLPEGGKTCNDDQGMGTIFL